jgi:dynein heavy chain
MERVTIKALVVIDVHARDVVDEMFRQGVSNVFEFGWSS